MSQHSLDIRIWDVEHGSAMFCRAGNKNIVIDCGANDSFSPIKWINGPKYGINTLHYLVISHPHEDHIEDLDSIKEVGLKPNIVNRPKPATSLVEDNLADAREQGNEEYIEDAEYYLNVLDKFSRTPEPAPSDPEWAIESATGGSLRSDGGNRGVTFHNYGTSDPDLGDDHYERLNNLSKITVINAFGFKFVTSGDLLPKGIEVIMEDSTAMDAIEDAHIFVAPHHGRDTSYVSEFVDRVNPELVIFSDKSDVDNTATDEYREHASGHMVTNEQTGTTRERRVLTTRNDGRIRVEASNASTWDVSISGKDYTASKAESRRYQRINSLL